MNKLMLLLLLLIVSPAQSDGIKDGITLLTECETGLGDPQFNACIAYIVGVTDAIDTAQNWSKFPKEYCTTTGVTQAQLLEVVVKYLNKRPERLHFDAGSLVWDALVKAFPCE